LRELDNKLLIEKRKKILKINLKVYIIKKAT